MCADDLCFRQYQTLAYKKCLTAHFDLLEFQSNGADMCFCSCEFAYVYLLVITVYVSLFYLHLRYVIVWLSEA